MTPKEFQQARHSLGLSLDEMGRMLGYVGEHVRVQMHDMEQGKKPIREPQRRLMEAYLAGYRPPDWPHG